jgi:hypothetical protein
MRLISSTNAQARGRAFASKASLPMPIGGRMKVMLTVTEGPHQGRSFTFQAHDTFIVGRSKDAHFRLPLKDKYFSRIHFMVEVNPPYCRLMDMASTNGTFVNGQKVTTIDLRAGDVIKGGRTVLAVALGKDDPRDETLPPPEGPGPPPSVEPPASVLEGPTAELTTTDPPVRFPTIPRYRIERGLGRGAMGVVYLARGAADGVPVALKMITPAVVSSAGSVARFLREASVLRQLDHPNIVKFREIGQAGGQLYFAMEYVPGTDAASLVRGHRGPLPIGRAVGLACQVLDALAFAHARGFVHRDIKPSNLLIAAGEARDVVKVADFGLARLYLNSPLSGLTVLGQAGGTSAYMPPEQVTDFREAKPASDLYSLGATLYYLLTGRKVYDFPEKLTLQLLMILQEDPVPIRARRADLPEALAAVIHRSLARDPAGRFPDAGAMRAALAPFERLR